MIELNTAPTEITDSSMGHQWMLKLGDERWLGKWIVKRG